ncbi:DUF2927 domain-containing protein [Pelagibius sp. 7325]|uniref:DUF2927 domain-containing protein n=2 Tax=Pseudomonadati TaxID=3379134 RepID=UPI0030EB7682
MRKSVAAWAFAGSLLLTACTAPAPSGDLAPDPAEEAILADFHRVAYGQPTISGGHLAKWTGPIRAAVIGTDRPDYRSAARRHLAELADLTGLAIAEAPADQANLLVFYDDDPFAAVRDNRSRFAHRIADPSSFDRRLDAMAPDATCFGFLWGGWPGGQGIGFAVVFLRTDRGDRTVEGCLVQQTTQALGLLHDLDPSAESVFGDAGKYVALTPQDRLILRLLYDPRLKPGMGWAEAEPLARAALRDLRKGGGG